MSKRNRHLRNANVKLEYRAVAAYWGLALGFIGLTMLFPLVALAAWPEEGLHAVHFIVPAVVLLVAGTSMYLGFRSRETVLTLQAGGLIVVLSWATACFVSAWPLIALEKLTFTQAVFESVSGWTTTGLSVVDVDAAQHLTLLWRSTMQLVGGAGFAIIMLAALTRSVGTGLATAEGRGEQLVPHVRESAKLVLFIYTAYMLAGVVAYWLAGMGWFDSINHAFAAISTGGFSTRPESIGYWDSPGVEAVTIALMILGNLNFLTAYALWRGRLWAVARDGEVQLMAIVIPASAMILFILVCHGLYPTLTKSMRVAVFETVTAVTTTGFSTVTYRDWNSLGVLVLVMAMLMGGGTCSTAGGIKQFRVYTLTKAISWEVRRWLLPPTAVCEHYVWHGGEREYVNDRQVRQTGVFVYLYALIFLAGTAILCAHGASLPDALFEFASAQGTVGISIGVTTPTVPPLVLWTEAAGMFLGRLEFVVVLSSLVKLSRDVPKLVSLRRERM